MLHGRERECVLIAGLLGGVREGRGGALVLRGEAGIGKSALLEHAAAQPGGMRVLRCNAVESESQLPYAAVHQLLRPVEDRLAVIPERQRAALWGAFGLADATAGDRFLVSVAVLSVLCGVAGDRPLLCVVDDAQWLDSASADALVFAARRLATEPVVLMFAARDDGVLGGLPEVRVGGLAPVAARALLSEASAVAPASEVADRLAEHTAGNPMGLLELSGLLSVEELTGARPLPARLPVGAGVARVFLAGVRRLPAAVQTLLLVAAVEERGDVGVVLRAAQALDIAPAALDEAESVGLVRVDGAAVTFCHPLVRAAVHQGATFLQRRAVEEALVAATSVRGRRLLEAAEAGWLAGQPDRARALLDQAVGLDDGPGLRARGEHLRGSIEGVCGRPDVAYAILSAAAEPIVSTDPARAARMLTEAGLLAWVSGDVPRLGAAGRRLAGLPAGGDAGLVVGLAALLDGDTGRAVALLRDGRDATGPLAEPQGPPLAGAAALFLGDDAAALDLLGTAVVRARAAGAVSALPLLLAPLAAVDMWTGRFDAAAASAGEGLRLALDTGQGNPAAHHRSLLAWIAAVQGRADDCRDAAAAALTHAIGQRLGPSAAIAHWALALLDVGTGRAAAAFDRLTALADAAAGEGHPMVKVFAAADLVEVAVRTGHRARAETALAALRRWAGPVGATWAQALVQRCVGLLASGDRADAHFAQALALHARAGRPFDTARTALLFGEALRRRRRRVEARGHLRAAYEAFERLGAAPWAEVARVELQATGQTARKRDPGTVGELTAQESQIVRLVARGGTNREIAAQLFLSPRTVEYHLHNVFGKVGVTSRAELIRWSIVDGAGRGER